MKNTLSDLNNHLFAQLERLNDEHITAENLDKEIRRSEAIVGTASQIIANANLLLRAQALKDNALDANFALPQMLKSGNDG